MDTAGIEFSFLLEYITINFLGQTYKLCFQYKSTLHYASEIPGELSHQNMISSHMKKSLLFGEIGGSVAEWPGCRT